MTSPRNCVDDIARQFLNMVFGKIPGNKNQNISHKRNEMKIIFAKRIIVDNDVTTFYGTIFKKINKEENSLLGFGIHENELLHIY